MTETVLGKLLGIPFITEIIKGIAALGYRKLKDINEVYKFLAEIGIEEPTDSHRSLYIHSLILLHSQINDGDCFKILIAEEAYVVFKSSYIETEAKEPFVIHVNNGLSNMENVEGADSENKVRSAKIVDEFIKIYKDLVKKVATPVQSRILNGMEGLNEGNSVTHRGIATILEKLEAQNTDSQFVKDQIKYANSFLENRRFESGIQALQNLEKNLNEIKSIEVRSTLLVNLGYACNEMGNKKEAGEYFKRAYEVNEENYAALCNYSQYLVADGSYALGEKLALKAVTLYGDKMPEVWEAYILVKQRSIGISEIIKELPRHFLNKAGVQRALAIASRSQGYEELYLEHVNKAYQLAPNDAGVKLSYIESILYKYQTNYKIYNIRSIESDLKKEIEGHLQLLDDILSSENDATDNKLFYLQAKSIFLYLLHREDEALAHFDTIEKEFSLEQRKLYQLKAMLLYVNGRSQEAVPILEKFIGSSVLKDDLLMLIEIASRANQADVVERAFEQLSEIKDTSLIYQGLQILIDFYISKDDVEKVNLWADRIKRYEGLGYRIIEAKILFHLESPEFESLLLICENQIDTESRFSIVNEIIGLYEKAGLWDKVVLLLEPRLTTLDYNSLTDRLLHAIENSGDIDKLVRTLESLRISKGIHPKYTAKECNLYVENYLYPKAVTIAKAYVNVYKDRIDMEIFIATIQFRIGDFPEVDLFLEREIEIDNLRKDDQNNYLVLLASRGKCLKCVEVLYNFHRKHKSPYSNDLYLMLWFKFDLLSNFIQPTVVGEGTAVVIYDGVKERRTLLIVGNEIQELDIHRYEVSIDDPVCLLINGQVVGFEFTLDDGFVRKRWRIESIESKYSYQLKKCQQDASGIFKRDGSVKAYHIEDIIAMMSLSKEKANEEDPIDQLFGFYQRMQVGIGTLSEVMEENVVNVRNKLLIKNINIAVSYGFKEELACLQFEKNDQEIVVDITGILTLHDLGMLDLVVTHFKNLSITHSTFEELNEFYHQNNFGAKRLKVSEEPLLALISTHFSVKYPNTITINRNEKKRLYSNFGISMYDSALLAKDNGAILFSDDFFLRTRTQTDLQIQTCWIIPFLKYLQQVSLIGRDFYHDRIIQLLDLHYKFIDINSQTLFHCLQTHNFAITNRFMDPLHMLTGKVSSLESVLETFFGFVELLIVSKKYQQEELFKITDVVLSYLTADRDLSELSIQYEKLISTKSKTEEQYYLMRYILNRYSLQFGVRLLG